MHTIKVNDMMITSTDDVSACVRCSVKTGRALAQLLAAFRVPVALQALGVKVAALVQHPS